MSNQYPVDDDYWREKLTAEEFRVTRQAGTERPFTGEYLLEQRNGDYLCKCCGEVLFGANDKFDSGCGWPSFSAQTEHNNVGYREDLSHGMRRTEIFCRHCDAHLGHVFPDGPAPTHQRYCVNSLSLKFSPK